MRRPGWSTAWRRLGATLTTRLAPALPHDSDPVGSLRTDGGTPSDREGGDDPASETDHVRDLPDGAGCTEIWEHLSDRADREGEADD